MSVEQKGPYMSEAQVGTIKKSDKIERNVG